MLKELLIGLVLTASTPVIAMAAQGPVSDADLSKWVDAHGQQWLIDRYPGENPQAEAQKAVSRYRQCESQDYSSLPVSMSKLGRYNSHDDPWFQKWSAIEEFLNTCPLQRADAGDEINNRNQSSNSQESTNINENDIETNAEGGDADATAEAYLEANPSASVGEVSSYLEQQLDLSNDNAVDVATQAKQRQEQRQRQTQSQGDDSSESTATNRNGDVVNENEYNNRDVEFGSLDAVQPGASAPAGQCTADLTIGQARSVVSAPVESNGGNGFGIQGGIDDSDSGTAVQGGLTFGSGQDTEGLSAEDCKAMLEPAMEAQRNMGNMFQGAGLKDLLFQPNQNVNIQQNENRGGGTAVPPLEFDN